MTIAIHLGSQLLSEAIQQLLARSGYDTVVVSGRPPTKGLTPDVLLVDSTTLRQDLLARYPDAKVLLIDTGMEPEQLCATLLAYRIHGVLSPDTELHLFKRALTAISEGQLWIDNGTVKTLLHDAGNLSPKGKISHITSREQEIIECICQGLSNKEIAKTLSLSEHTVKAHLSTIFKKFNVTSRSKLVSLAMSSGH
ncbi:MAG: response regulator transcription factor [Syntrophorhabdales bacterium]|jgi:DNA-binding NarL/FixJ family response regulator